MADQASSSTTISADPAAILAVIKDVEAYPEWTKGISKAAIVEEGKDGPAKVTFSMAQSGLSDEYTLVYDWQPDGVSWKLAEPSAVQRSQTGSYKLEPSGSATKVTYLLTIDLKIPMIGMLKRRAEKFIIDSALSELKKRVESLG